MYAPALSVAGFARDQLSHAITAARFLDEVSPKSAVREEANQVRVSGSSESDATEVSERAETLRKSTLASPNASCLTSQTRCAKCS